MAVPNDLPLPISDSLRASLAAFHTDINKTSAELNRPKWLPDFSKFLNKFTTDVMLAVVALEKQNLKLESDIAVLKTTSGVLEGDRNRLMEELDEMQQYSRRTNILIHGVDESANEVTDDIVLDIANNSLDLPEISKTDLSRSHRLGKKVEGKTRPIIARFVSYRSKGDIYKNKKKLKGKGIVITENLTKKRYELYKMCKTRFGPDKCWTLDGKIICLTGRLDRYGNPVKRTVTKENDIPT
jgi:hypothetical protein